MIGIVTIKTTSNNYYLLSSDSIHMYRLTWSTFHQVYRQQQLDRINKDNKILMERLQSVKPYYDRMEWVSGLVGLMYCVQYCIVFQFNHHLKHLKHSTYISQFPDHTTSWVKTKPSTAPLLKTAQLDTVCPLPHT